jgi:hypothetical protein
MQPGKGAFTLRSRVSMGGRVSVCDRVAMCDRVSVRRRYRMTVRRTDSVDLVPAGILAVV